MHQSQLSYMTTPDTNGLVAEPCFNVGTPISFEIPQLNPCDPKIKHTGIIHKHFVTTKMALVEMTTIKGMCIVPCNKLSQNL